MDLRHLRSFVAVAEELSFRRAAERLHLSQPPLTRQIKALEENLGVRLLERGRAKRVTLTAAGQSYLADARRTLAGLAGARERAREAEQGARSLLKLADVAALATPVVFPLLQAFRETFPQVQVSLVELLPPEQLTALDEGRIHAAICPDIGQSLNRRFQSQPLFACPMVVALPAGHPLARQDRKPMDISELEGQTLLILSPETRPGYLETLNALCAAANFTPTAMQPVDMVENLLGMVAAGYGVTILPEMVARAGGPACHTRPLRPPVPTFRLRLLWHREAPPSVLLDFLAVAKRWTKDRGTGDDTPRVEREAQRGTGK